MKIKLGFNPNESGEAQAIFIAGGAALKFWLLWRMGHMTNQHFNESVLNLADEICILESKGVNAYSTPKEFIDIVERSFIKGRDYLGYDLKNFVFEYWEFLSPNIRRRVCYSYETESGKTKTRVVTNGAFRN